MSENDTQTLSATATRPRNHVAGAAHLICTTGLMLNIPAATTELTHLIFSFGLKRNIKKVDLGW